MKISIFYVIYKKLAAGGELAQSICYLKTTFGDALARGFFKITHRPQIRRMNGSRKPVAGLCG